MRRRAIKCMCSHCQHEAYYETSVALEAISNSRCAKCGNTGAVITLDIEPPRDIPIRDRVSQGARLAREMDAQHTRQRCAN